MKKLQLLFFLLFSIATLSLTSCDDDDKEDEPSRRELLTAGEWTAFSVYRGGQDITPLLMAGGVNVSDVKITFVDNRTYVLDFEGDKMPGTWEFTDNEQKLLLNKGITNAEVTASINNLDISELYLEGNLQT